MNRKHCFAMFAAFLLAAFTTAAQTPERAQAPARPAAPAADKDKRVVEQIIARVNNEIITLSDLRNARSSLLQDLQEECRNCTQVQLNAQAAEREPNILRDLIDQSLLVQRGKDKGINVETDVVKRMDEIRVRNKLPTMEALQAEVEKTGITFEEFRNNIRNNLLVQEVVRSEVGGRISNLMDREEVKKVYEEHKQEFNRPEMVYLSEIFVSTVGKTEEEIPPLEARAKKLLDRVKNGEDFEELAKRYSEGDTAKEGGNLGGFKRGQLSPELEEVVFKMKPKELSDVIRTKTGFLVLRVDMRYEAGVQPIEKVETEIMNRLYQEKMQPAMRAYLTKLREESYVVVTPGYVDTSAVASNPIVEVEPAADEGKNKKGKKGKKSEPASKEKKSGDKKGKKAGA